MNEAMLLVLDEGTTSTRAMLYTPDGVRVGMVQRDLTQYYPRPGWVEQDAPEIWERPLACAQEMVAQAGGAPSSGRTGAPPTSARRCARRAINR